MTGDGMQDGATESLPNEAIVDGVSWEREGERTPVYAVVSAIARESGTDVFELPPLYESIDPDALNSLFTSRPDTTVRRVRFEYAGYDVEVHGSTEVRVRPIEER